MPVPKLAIGALLALCGLAQAAPSLCRAGAEREVFSCQAGRKTISVCAESAPSRQKQLAYRYGRPGHPELSIVQPVAAQAAGVFVGLITVSGGGGTTLRFHSDGHDYTVYSFTSAALGDKAGVTVAAAGKRIANVHCRDEPQPDLDHDGLVRSGVAADAESFQLP
ncbi:MAG: hypothetical protein JWQ76_3003 [Ramlibacter sp.]|nr:hypothetical protein [Ramlibacter sp.]